MVLGGFAQALHETTRPWCAGPPVSDPARFKPLRQAGAETGVLAAHDRAFPQNNTRFTLAAAVSPLAAWRRRGCSTGSLTSGHNAATATKVLCKGPRRSLFCQV